MAAAPGPDEVLYSTPGKANFQRLTRLLISGGTTLLREIFDIRCPPSDLPRILQNSATVKQLKAAKLTKPQWDCLYPSPGTYGKSADFDVTLLFKLLKTICSLIPPSTGWDALPASTDHSLAADLARIKYYRNSVYGHVHQRMEITDDEFPSLWQEISKALLGIADNINTKKKNEWQTAINNFLKDPLTAQDERNEQELLYWYKNDTDLKEYVEKLDSSIQNVENRIKHLETSIRGRNQAEEEKGQRLEKAFEEEAKGIKDQLGGEVKTTKEEVQSLRKEFREEAQDIKDQLGGEAKTTTEEVQSLRKEFREEVQGIKKELGEVRQSIDSPQATRVQLRIRMDCETIPESSSQVGASESMFLASQGPHRSDQEMVVAESTVPIASSDQLQAVMTRGSETANAANDGLPSSQRVLNFIALKYFETVDTSSEDELNRYLQYLKDVRKVLIVDAQTGSLIITVECGSLEILEKLWDDYCTGHLNEMAQKYLVTEEVLKEFGLVEVKLSTTIHEEEYRAGREYFMQSSGLELSQLTSVANNKEPVDVSPTHHNLSDYEQRNLGDLQQAKEHYERVLDMQLKNLGPEHIDVAVTCTILGVVKRDLDDLLQAKEHFERALHIRLKHFGPEHVEVAASYHNLGTVQSYLGDPQQAKKNYIRALDIRMKQLGPEHFDVAGTYSNLGVVERYLGDLKQAEEHYKRAIDIWLKKSGPNPVYVASTYNNLGNVQRDLGKLQQAKLHYERALEIWLKELGPDHVYVASAYSNLGNIQHYLGELQQAKEHYQRALDIQMKTRGPQQASDVAHTLENLDNVQRDLDELPRANEGSL